MKKKKPSDEEVIRKMTGREVIPKALKGNGTELAKALWYYMQNWNNPDGNYEVIKEYSGGQEIDILGREMFFKGMAIARERITKAVQEKDNSLLTELSDYLTRLKFLYVQRLRDSQQEIHPQTISIQLVRFICDLDYILNTFATGVIVHSPPNYKVPKYLADWKPFLRDDDFQLYLVAREQQKHKGVEDLIIKGIATSRIINVQMLNRSLTYIEASMNWADAIEALELNAMTNLTFLFYSKEVINKAVEKHKGNGKTAEKAEDQADKFPEPGEIPPAPNMDMKSQVLVICKLIQQGGVEELAEPWQKTMLKRMESKESTPKKYVGLFIKGEFRAKMKKVVEALLHPDNNYKISYDVVMEEIVGCNEWFYGWVAESLKTLCNTPNLDFYNMVNGEQLAIKEGRGNQYFILLGRR